MGHWAWLKTQSLGTGLGLRPRCFDSKSQSLGLTRCYPIRFPTVMTVGQLRYANIAFFWFFFRLDYVFIPSIRQNIHSTFIVLDRYLRLMGINDSQTGQRLAYPPFAAGIDLPHQGVVDSILSLENRACIWCQYPIRRKIFWAASLTITSLSNHIAVKFDRRIVCSAVKFQRPGNSKYQYQGFKILSDVDMRWSFGYIIYKRPSGAEHAEPIPGD